ncbi:1,4-dihydroxy-2-naphthoate polyprenyltransferase [Erwinia sp. 198]|uniref:1,4-dihydroxy-2-naphthoate polyprenyltransferase n=1 Tax=Erwinia sp. 198 TaxID=2022746 RepID=UPI000F686A12|nr:1,4-dihydroxy-2-naphthoate polyprenyltransferase [Erwinia sp. 198]RRZ87778.1 1,4-dihydroxy-2-naphthoate polyprenyltransferase [Erwinia sp. 198]
MSDNLSAVPAFTSFRAWLESLRLRTLPLACASVITGSALAWHAGHFDPAVALLTLLTTALLQILSNLANDYGDAVKGSDTPDRLGPLRGMQKGLISLKQMRFALALSVALTLIAGVTLVVRACQSLGDILGFLALGALAIVAAIAYTVGKKPYGYLGLGDLSVLVFFGWLGVVGSFYLQTHRLHLLAFLPATGCGMLAVAVLNVNNMRDIDSDRRNGKFTLAVRLGACNARYYHAMLLSGALLCFGVYAKLAMLDASGWLFLLSAPLLFGQARFVIKHTAAAAMRPVMEKTVKATLLVNLLFAIGLAMN